MWEMDQKEGWAPKNWCFWIVILEKTLKNLLDTKEMKPVNPKGNQPWIFTGRTDAEAETSILWPADANSWLSGKDLMLGKIEGRRRGQQRMWWWDGLTDSMNMSLSELWETDSEGQGWPGVPQSMGCRVGHDLVTEQQNIKDIFPWFLAYLLILSFIVEKCLLFGSKIYQKALLAFWLRLYWQYRIIWGNLTVAWY